MKLKKKKGTSESEKEKYRKGEKGVGEAWEWHVSKASRSFWVIQRWTYFFWISLRGHHRSLSLCHKHFTGAKVVKEKWTWSQFEAISKHFSVTISPHIPLSSDFPPLPSLKPTPPHKHNTPPSNICVYVFVCVCACECVCMCKCPLLPQSLHGWVVAAAQLPATGSSSGSPSLHSLPALKHFCCGCQSQPAFSWGKSSTWGKTCLV